MSVLARPCQRLLVATVATALLAGSAVATVAQPAAAAPPPVTENDPVIRWTHHLQDVFRQTTSGPAVAARGAALMYLSIFDAVSSVRYSGDAYMGIVIVGPDCLSDEQQCVAAAVTAAAATSLTAAFPDQATFIGAAREAEEQRIGTGPAAAEGRSIGERSAEGPIFARSNDRSDNTTPYVPDAVPGAWRPTGNGCNTPVSPNWGQVRPFDHFPELLFFSSPPLPGGFASYDALLRSPLYAQQVNEVQALGRFDSTTRTAEQTQIAHFWANDVPGTYLLPGQLLDHTRIVSQQRGLTVFQNARLFGLVAMAMGESAILTWHAKFGRAIDLWRPETAIHLAGTDNNTATTPDPTWEPLSEQANELHFSPCSPAHASAHAAFAGAWAQVMRSFFGTDNIAFTATTDDFNAIGVTRTFTSFTAAAQENARSRVYLGVNYQFDADDGLRSGTRVATRLTQHYLVMPEGPPATPSTGVALVAP